MSFCPNCGTKIGENVKFCSGCGIAIVNSGENKVGNMLESTGGKLKNLFSGIQNAVKEVEKSAVAKSRINDIIYDYVQELTDEQMDTMLAFYVLDFSIGADERKSGIADFFLNIENETFIDEFIDASTSINKDEIVEFYNVSLSGLLEEIRNVENFKVYFSGDKANKIANDMYIKLLDLLGKKVAKKLETELGGYKKDSFQLISKIGYENFYNPRYMVFHAISCKSFAWKNFMQDYDKNTIEGVRQYLLRELANEMTANIERKETVQLKNGNPVCIWKSNNMFCMLALDCTTIVSVEQKNKLKELAYREIKIDDIEYFKVKGEYHRDQKISGGGTNVFLSQASVSRGNYTDEIKSETVVTDTRYVVLHTVEKDYNFTYESLDGFKDIIPEKDDDIVSEIKRQNIISGVASVGVQEEKKENVSSADNSVEEILKYKQLLDSGILTQEEFEAKKKQILGI